ncbi:MAG: helix-turn-helix domain-containing protein [Chthoniobacterales bacterium]
MSFQTRRPPVREASRAHSTRRARRQVRSSRKSLGERLCDWREANDLSQSEAAMKLKISKRTLQEWEQGRAEPRHLAMEAIIDSIS